jgi:hypothetical protein
MKKLRKSKNRTDEATCSSRLGWASLLAVASLVLPLHLVQAAPTTLSYDELLVPSDVNRAFLSGEVQMEVVNGKLCIWLQNTSEDAAGSGAGVLLTGIGFNLPGGVWIASGEAMSGIDSVGVGFTGTDVSTEWGYDNQPLNSGAMIGQPVNTAISSMVSQTTDQFAAGSIDSAPGNLNGPDFGLVSAAEIDPIGKGVEAIRDAIKITLDLSGNYEGDLVEFIDSRHVVLTFGSPTGAVPDASTTAMLLGMAMLGVEGLRRRIGRN